MILVIDGSWATGLCCFGIHAGIETLQAHFISVDEVVADNHTDGKQTARTQWDGINR